MNLNQLRHLIGIVESQSFSKAAAALFLTQSALSRSIQALEEELGVALLDRSGRRIIPTAYGEQVLAHARRVMFEVGEMNRALTLVKNAECGTLSFGCGAGPAAVLEVPFLTHMVRHHPGVQVQAARGATDLLLGALRSEQLDVLVVDRRALIVAEDLAIEALPSLRGGFACRAGHPLAGCGPVSLDRLRAYPVISTPLSDELARDLVLELGPQAHPDRLMNVRCQDIHSLLDVVETSDAVVFTVFAAARARFEAGRLCELRIEPHVEREGRFALVTLAGRTEAPATALFRTFVRDCFRA
jgi:DNA-binding transcriptional LysR family regulator